MIEFKEALSLVVQDVPVMGTEKVDFREALGRILAADVTSDVDMPPFDKSAMDGYACRISDLDQPLEVIGMVAAGELPEMVINKNQCVKIMTGAMIPEGADCVIKVEDTRMQNSEFVEFLQEKTKTNIARKAEDIQVGDVVLKKGTPITPQHIAILASVGCVKPEVSRKVQVGIISTGNEIVEPEKIPGLSQIRNSNGHQLVAQAKAIGAEPHYYGIARDTEEETYDILEKAIDENNVVLLSGGVSMGDFDFIPKVFQQLGLKILFSTVAMQPGKPTVFGHLGEKRIFGLPGNPVSSFNTFNIFVKPLLFRMMGGIEKEANYILPMGKAYMRKKSSRMSWIPVIISSQGKVLPVEYHGSAHIHALNKADGVVAIPIGETSLKEGDLVHVRPI